MRLLVVLVESMKGQVQVLSMIEEVVRVHEGRFKSDYIDHENACRDQESDFEAVRVLVKLQMLRVRVLVETVKVIIEPVREAAPWLKVILFCYLVCSEKLNFPADI